MFSSTDAGSIPSLHRADGANTSVTEGVLLLDGLAFAPIQSVIDVPGVEVIAPVMGDGSTLTAAVGALKPAPRAVEAHELLSAGFVHDATGIGWRTTMTSRRGVHQTIPGGFGGASPGCLNAFSATDSRWAMISRRRALPRLIRRLLLSR